MKWDTELKFTNASFKMTAYYPKEGDYIVLEQSLNDVMFQLVMKFLKTYKKFNDIIYHCLLSKIVGMINIMN